MTVLNDFFSPLWQQYSAISPQASAIQRLFAEEGEPLVNDHIAFRTFADSPISIDYLEKEIFALGYRHLDSYHFAKKKLDARCYIHPQSATKIFISELLRSELSVGAQNIINKLLEQITTEACIDLHAGRIWQLPDYADYLTLLEESEYAAWLSVWGLRANHFTLFVNHFKKYRQLSQVVDLLQQQGYQLNSAGGVIKGSADDLLIQASTMADLCEVEFEDAGKQRITTCYYEFAQRFKQADGQLFQGFVPGSADKIFESTNIGGSND
ncbi:DUF1338 domain-containing protein [Psychromonas ossibalaenae]|uniref:DUF1338 domain-containing protein n=1 Tax=Psychromonas ossibalaenae TaxID=444922 RepID=UPI00036F6882|nr:DUF1338 domain-containing protein [Psychromonas ossibalaenae]